MMQENKDNSMYRSNNGNHDDNDEVKYRLLRILEHLQSFVQFFWGEEGRFLDPRYIHKSRNCH